MIRLRIMFVVISIMTPSLLCAQKNLRDYVGVYILDTKATPGSPLLLQFEFYLNPDKPDSAVEFSNRAVFFTDTTLASVNALVDCKLVELSLRNDSLFVSTEERFGEWYEFAGIFIVPRDQFGMATHSIVLEGLLNWHQRGRPSKLLKAKFQYSAGC
jgi:hypothetical protein